MAIACAGCRDELLAPEHHHADPQLPALFWGGHDAYLLLHPSPFPEDLVLASIRDSVRTLPPVPYRRLGLSPSLPSSELLSSATPWT